MDKEKEKEIDDLIESRKIKNLPECNNCPYMIIPYERRLDSRRRPIPYGEIIPTCKKLVGAGYGFYADCNPEECGIRKV